MNPVEVSVIIFLCIFAGALLGMWLRKVLPEHHLDAETKDVMKLGAGLIGTMAALLLGLLVASAKSSYDATNSELAQMAANAILLDRMLAHYGPETDEIRVVLKTAAEGTVARLWSKNSKEAGTLSSQASPTEVVLTRIQQLTPANAYQRAIQAQAESLALSVGQMRWLFFEQRGSAISVPFLVVVVFWLSVLFMSFGLFAPHNATAVITLLVSAMAVAGALFLILELDHPFSGLIQISSEPLPNALSILGK